MTLKEFLLTHKVKATPDQRSCIGRLISTENDSDRLTLEDGHNVKDYKEDALNNDKKIELIINFLNKN